MDQKITKKKAPKKKMRKSKTKTQQLIAEITRLGKTRDESHVGTLVQFLCHSDGNVRRSTCSALGKIGSSAAEKPLIGMLFDEKPQVRQYALSALEKLGTKDCLPALEMIIKNQREKDYNVSAARTAIRRISKRFVAGGKPRKAGSDQPTGLRAIERKKSNLSLKLSPDQNQVLSALIEWLKKPKGQFITAGGYAGTGKTTLIGVLRKVIKDSSPKIQIAFACYTGKASQVLKHKLIEQLALYRGDFCGTIHSLMYSPILNAQGKITGWRRNKSIPHDLIIVDEASMVTENIWRDLSSYKIPIIAVGDHGQLPPIGDGFNLMDNPILKLEKIHRQARGNPIIEIATLARTSGNIPLKEFNPRVRKIKKQTAEAQMVCEKIFSDHNDQTLILCGRNKTRVRLNGFIREKLGYHSEQPIEGETLICLKNNYKNPGGPIFNGMLGKLLRIKPHRKHWYEADIFFSDEDRHFKGFISKHQFGRERFIEHVNGVHYRDIGDRFDFGYALTVHKAQGSQANRVLLFEEPSSHWPGELWNRWLYTAVTRAIEELYIVGG